MSTFLRHDLLRFKQRLSHAFTDRLEGFYSLFFDTTKGQGLASCSLQYRRLVGVIELVLQSCDRHLDRPVRRWGMGEGFCRKLVQFVFFTSSSFSTSATDLKVQQWLRLKEFKHSNVITIFGITAAT